MACARAGRPRTGSKNRSSPARCRRKATSFDRTARSPPGTAGVSWIRSCPASSKMRGWCQTCAKPNRIGLGRRQKRGNGPKQLATVTTPEAFDRLVAHRRPAIGVQELARVARPEVVLQRPHSGREVDLRIAEARQAEVD